MLHHYWGVNKLFPPEADPPASLSRMRGEPLAELYFVNSRELSRRKVGMTL